MNQKLDMKFVRGGLRNRVRPEHHVTCPKTGKDDQLVQPLTNRAGTWKGTCHTCVHFVKQGLDYIVCNYGQ